MNIYIARKTLFGLAGLAFVLSMNQVSAATTKKEDKLINDKFAVNAELTEPIIMEGGTETITVTVSNKGKNQRGVVNIELFNDSNEQVDQDYFTNVKLNKGKKMTFKVTTPSDLSPGVYHYGIGVFGPAWKEPHAWYHELPNFVVVAK